MNIIGPDKVLSQAEIEAILTADVCKKIDVWRSKFPENQAQSALLASLTESQQAHDGYVTDEHITAIASLLSIPKIMVYESASFYSMIELKPVGKHVINICTNIACQLKGSEPIQKTLEEKLNITCGQTTKDGRYTLRAVECLAACVQAPAMQIADKYHEYLTPESALRVIDELE